MANHAIISPPGFSWCSSCKKHLPITQFGPNRRNSLKGIDWYCKTCRATQHKTRQPKRRAARLERKRQWVIQKGNRCIICGRANLPMACLTFHHHDPTTKEASIKNLLDMTDEESLRVEMDKCDLVCENCHRIIHHGTETAEPVYNFDATAGKVSSITITNGRITSITTA